ncbi:MAG: hypothetical protein U9Q81_06205 [Pseudomonadota bacterium]|nr:hypothetical protein [Pseudomonadota bacterium]
MKIVKRILIAAGIAAALVAIPTQTANAYWLGPGPGFGPWRHSYVHDPNYRWAPPATRKYIRDLHLYGPGYANWNQHRRYRYRWW